MLTLVLLGILVGVLIGALGGGGGVIAVPLFIWAVRMSAVDASTYSLVTVVGAAFVATIIGAAMKEIRWRWVLGFAGAGLVGAVAGSMIVGRIDHLALLIIFAVIVLVAGLRLLLNLVRTPAPPRLTVFPRLAATALAATGSPRRLRPEEGTRTRGGCRPSSQHSASSRMSARFGQARRWPCPGWRPDTDALALCGRLPGRSLPRSLREVCDAPARVSTGRAMWREGRSVPRAAPMRSLRTACRHCPVVRTLRS